MSSYRCICIWYYKVGIPGFENAECLCLFYFQSYISKITVALLYIHKNPSVALLLVLNSQLTTTQNRKSLKSNGNVDNTVVVKCIVTGESSLIASKIYCHLVKFSPITLFGSTTIVAFAMRRVRIPLKAFPFCRKLLHSLQTRHMPK